MKNNKKILGIPMALFLVGLLVVGGASAAIVAYLSNSASVDVKVDSPTSLLVANTGTTDWETDGVTYLNLGQAYGGDTITFDYNVTNLASVTTSGNFNVTFSNDISGVSDVTCEDFSKVTFKGITVLDNSVPALFPGACAIQSDGTVKFVGSFSLVSGETEVGTVTATFVPNVAPSTYTIDARLVV